MMLILSLEKGLISVFVFSVFNDGSKNELLSLDGTIPVSYKGKFCVMCAEI